MTFYSSIFTSQFKTFVDSICMQCLQMVQEQLYSLPENFDHTKHLNIYFMSALFLSVFQLILNLNPDFNFSTSFVLSWIDEVTPET